jgi:hypothetical protein
LTDINDTLKEVSDGPTQLELLEEAPRSVDFGRLRCRRPQEENVTKRDGFHRCHFVGGDSSSD